MAAKILHSLADENPDLQKQMMNGISQLFDHQHILNLRQISHKRLPAGNSPYGSDIGREYVIQHREQDQEMNRSENAYEKQRVPKDLSRVSFSPAFPSSFASLERSRIARFETSSFDPAVSPEMLIQHPAKNNRKKNSHVRRNLQDFRDVVKDSINRDPGKLSVKRPVIEESPMPSNGYESKLNIPIDLQESLRLLAKHSGFPKDAIRFSYNGRDINRLSFESRKTVQSTQKLKELPRLSFDGRDRSAGEPRSASVSTQSRPLSVVVKLMGLEALPDSWSGDDTLSKSEKYGSSLDKNGGSSKPCFKRAKSPVKAPYPVPSLYEQEFKQSGKDIIALKQIIEAMQTKGLLNAKKEEPTSNLKSPKDNLSKYDNLNHNPKGSSRQNIYPMSGHNSSRAYESPIVIMKPAKPVKTFGIAASSVIPMDTRQNSGGSRIVFERSPRKVRSRPQQISKESSVYAMKHSGSLSPRLIHKKIELENQARPASPPSDSKRRTSNKKASELVIRGETLRPKSSNSLHCDDISLHSDNNLLMDSKTDVEVTNNERFSPEDVKYSIPDSITNASALRCMNEYESMEELAKVNSEHPSPVSILDASVYGDDELSPVKGMQGDGDLNPDCSLHEYQYSNEYNDFSSSLGSEINRMKLKNIDILVQKLRRLNSDHDETKTDYIASLCENTNPDHRYISEILLACGLLLRDLGSGLTTFQLHHSGHPINPELFFVLEQTMMSKEDDIYLKVSNKFHRKLIFDAVNEILATRLAFIGASSEPWLKQNKHEGKNLSAQKILREICAEIEQFQEKKCVCSLDSGVDGLESILSDEVMHRSGSWTDLHCEVPCVVLDVERSIFKDLIDEILIDGKTYFRVKSGRCKQLFF